MASCRNFYLFEEFKLHSKVFFFFEKRHDMFVFILNVVLNIQKYFMDSCKCNGEAVCTPCEMAETFSHQTFYKVYKNCLDLEVLYKVKENLHLKLNELLEQHDHFLCKVLNERFHYEHKCIFTGRHVFLDVGIAALEWEKSKVNEIVNDKTTVFVENYFKENSFFKVK